RQAALAFPPLFWVMIFHPEINLINDNTPHYLGAAVAALSIFLILFLIPGIHCKTATACYAHIHTYKSVALLLGYVHI
ncbi:hypothetical protein, partial [Serratia marcescens]|uniref:hypothetical protein n=1 Tax=Serratia marcescens TaxID=615 RepID=UPI001F2C3A8F